MMFRKNSSLISGIMWIVILISVVLFFMPVIDIELFGNPKITRLIGSLFVLFGIIFDIVMRVKGKNDIIDERVSKIQGKTVINASIATLTINFLVCMFIYDLNTTGFVDVNWLWFIAYLSFALFFALGNILYFVYDNKDNDYEDR